MHRVYRTALALAAVSWLFVMSVKASSLFSGRWDLTVVTSEGVRAKGTFPSWMEFADEGEMPAIRIVGRTGSVHPVRNEHVNGAHLTFEDPATPGAAPWQIVIRNRKLTGQTPDGQLSGVPAPALKNEKPSAWTTPEPLLTNSRDNMDNIPGWEADNPAENHWIARNGVLENLHAGSNIRTSRKFGDFKLHIEYNCPSGGNSGVYLRGRYEVQVEYEPPSKNDTFHGMGSIYGFIAPAGKVDPRPGQWEAYDVTLVGRYVSVIRDSALIIDNAEIPGITGGALDSNEGDAGPLYLQGDHTGGLKYRNITISVPQRLRAPGSFDSQYHRLLDH